MALMGQQIGQRTERITASDLIARSRARAALVPDLFVEAGRVANTVIGGWHGRRKRGIGENFWQFRPFGEGENVAAIDWRRSARDEDVYVRDREWEAVHTVWLWAAASPSMQFASKGATPSKQERALVIALAAIEILARSGERIGYLGAGAPLTHRHAAERIAAKLTRFDQTDTWPATAEIKTHADLVLVSDFLDPIEQTISRMEELSARRIRGHLVQIVDPAEETFPYSGRTDFIDPERGVKITLGRAQGVAEDYQRLFNARRQTLREAATKRGWSFITHHTDKPASEALVGLHMRLSEPSAGAN
jgi:uncharacterized protein (DUF58 family)